MRRRGADRVVRPYEGIAAVCRSAGGFGVAAGLAGHAGPALRRAVTFAMQPGVVIMVAGVRAIRESPLRFSLPVASFSVGALHEAPVARWQI